MNGLEFVKTVKGVPSVNEIPVVMITTEGGERLVAEALSHGAKGYVRKPFTQEQFASCIIPLIA
jgi:two-component system chemotaxis response regulator CheY